MSVNALSAAALKHILGNVSGNLFLNKEALDDALEELSKKTGRKKEDLLKTIVVSKGTRLLTNKFQDGVLSENALTLLSNQLNDVANLRNIDTDALTRYTKKVGKNVSEDDILVSFFGKENKKLILYIKNNIVNKFQSPSDTDSKKPFSYSTAVSPNDLFIKDINRLIENLGSQASNLISQPDLLSRFVNFLQNNARYKSKLENIPPSTPIKIALRDIEHRELNVAFSQFLLAEKVPNYLIEFIDSNTDAGHLLGVFTVRIVTLFNREGSQNIDVKMHSSGVPIISFTGIFKNTHAKRQKLSTAEREINKLFQQSAQLSLNADSITSNLINDLQLFVTISRQNLSSTATGKKPGSAAEIQLSKFNQLAGSKLNEIGKKLRRISVLSLDTSLSDDAKERQTRDALKAYFDSFKNLGQFIQDVGTELQKPKFKTLVNQSIVRKLQKHSAKIGRELLQSQGSDTFFESIKYSFAGILNNTKYIGASTTAKTASKTLPKTNKALGNIKPIKLTTLTKQQSVNKPLTYKKPIIVNRNINRATESFSTNLPNLLNQINGLIQQQVQRNMGTGSSTNVLNYRSGRFAESVKVERLSESRQGMITAFYSYMKNPYATFSKGGRQERPASRDPKLLISKSIREIAQTVVTNQLRAVNV